MGKQKTLLISIPSPCSENWDEMKKQKNGKLCANCNKEVVDFTGFSDSDLFNYLRSHPNSCGRFFEDQLGRVIVPAEHRKEPWRKLYRFAAGLITFISLEGLANDSEKRQFGTYLQSSLQRPGDIPLKNDSTIIPPKNELAIIRGQVTDKSGEPLIGAEVSWNGQPVSTTGEDGRFEIVLGTSLGLKAGIISLSYPELVPVVRNYHPSMGNIDYDLRLCKPAKCGVFMGVPVFDSTFFEIPAIQFVQKSIELNDDHRLILATLAEKLKNNPDVSIGLSTGANSPPEIRRAKYMLSLVRNWLVDNEGISEDRINIDSKLDHPTLIKTVEIKVRPKEY